jgi:hypothetical protein
MTDLAKTRSFPAKLFRMLEDPDCQECISWQPHGRSWKIHNQHEFEEKVIPLFFRHAKLSSFMRQVNGWGFIRTPTGPDQNAYYHDMFRRGYPKLCARMRRPPHKVRSKSEIAANPNAQNSRLQVPPRVPSARDAKVSASAAKRPKEGPSDPVDDADRDTDGKSSHEDSDSDVGADDDDSDEET